ncbi:thioredoxin-like protein [Algoriphagus aquaeductus]|uniref:Thioredoxin-like protein n=1 Tax=Algoriphagus aquaeductus TaxID=475299 RepID=A0A326RNS4_9BACT|nr:thioredoxin family protein [Algoriphagus aquaeductus]PZV82292.1 thioredoxin-like protein [Algoriphagus aquaeductus]
MKKFLLTCFLALPCLFGSTSLLSLVAQSPGADLLHRFGGPNRGGPFSRPDTFAQLDNSAETSVEAIYTTDVSAIDGGPALRSAVSHLPASIKETASLRAFARSDDPLHWESVLSTVKASDIRHRTSDIKLNFGLVDSDQDMRVGLGVSGLQSPSFPVFRNQDSSGREAYSRSTEAQSLASNVLCLSSSSSLASPSPALIYGELINPDSLGPLKVELIRHYTDRKSTFEKDDFLIETWPGEFFDGVVDPRAQKFSLSIPDLIQPAYLSLTIQNRPLLDRYLIFPGDSLKIGINLAQSTLVFGGPAAAQMEAQFQLRRIKLQNEFDQPRKIVVSNADDLLDQEDNRERWEANQVKFSSKLEFEKYGSEGLDKILGSLQNQDTLLCQIDEWLDLFGKNLSEQKKDLIRLDAFSGQLLGPVSMINRFYYQELRGQLQGEAWTEKLDLILNALLVFKEGAFDPESRKISASYLDFQMERLALISLIKGISFHDAVEQTYQGELADKLKASFLIQNLKRYPDPKALIDLYSKTVQSPFWRNRIQQLGASTIPGGTLISLELEDTLGNRILTSSLPAKPTLIYFYFSTCVHSAHYFQDLLWPLYKVMAKEMGVSLIAISVDKDRNLWLKRLPEYSNLEIPNYRLTESNKQKLVDYYEFSGYPRTFFIDADRRILSFGLDRTDSAKFTRSFLTILSAINPSNSNPNIPTL